MDHRIHQINHHPLSQIKSKVKNETKSTVSFRDQFNSTLQESDGLKISKHAQKRLDERKININSSQWNEIEARVREARKKGVKESLVVTTDAALLVSAKNNTVITAMDRDEAKSQIFTNINGTIIL